MAAKTTAAEIRALLIYIYKAQGIWLTREQVNHLIGGSNALIDQVRAQTISEHEESPIESYFDALALLHGYTTPQHAKEKIDNLLAQSNHQRLSRDELRATAAMRCPGKDTQHLTKSALTDLLQRRQREVFLKSVETLDMPTEKQIQDKILDHLTKRGQIDFELTRQAKEENARREKTTNSTKTTDPKKTIPADLLAEREMNLIIEQIARDRRKAPTSK